MTGNTGVVKTPVKQIKHPETNFLMHRYIYIYVLIKRKSDSAQLEAYVLYIVFRLLNIDTMCTHQRRQPLLNPICQMIDKTDCH